MRRSALVLLLAAIVAALVVAGVVLTRDDEESAPRGAPSASDEGGQPTSSTTAAPSGVAGRHGDGGVGDPYFPHLGNGGYDVAHYHLELAWDADEAHLSGMATIDAQATHDLSRFNLDLSGMDVRSVSVDGAGVEHSRLDRELLITPSSPIAEGDEFQVEVVYEGSPRPITEGTTLFELGWQTDGREAFVASEPAGAATFFPVNDHPTDKATYSFEITAPADLVAVANGLLVDGPIDGPDDTRTWIYEADDLMASYLVQVAIGDFELVDGGTVGDVVIRHAIHSSLAGPAQDTLARTAEMLAMLTEVFGPYPFDAYGVVAVDEPLGFALETQTLTLIGTDVASAGRSSDDILLHELAHQWVGNSVSPASWKDIWLNEGFASYAEWLWAERTGGPSAADTAREVRLQAFRVIQGPPGDPGFQEIFAPTVYLRGGLALQALREAMGDDAFFELLRRWVADNDDSHASTEDLVDLAGEISGQDHRALLDAWLYGDEVPRLG